MTREKLSEIEQLFSNPEKPLNISVFAAAHGVILALLENFEEAEGKFFDAVKFAVQELNEDLMDYDDDDDDEGPVTSSIFSFKAVPYQIFVEQCLKAAKSRNIMELFEI